MRAEVFQYRDVKSPPAEWALAVVLAVLFHLLVGIIMFVGWHWLPAREAMEPAAGSPMIEASLVFSAADIARANKAMESVPTPEPVREPIPIDDDETIPPPQPIEVRQPQTATAPQQERAQDFIPEPDTVDQDAARAESIAAETAAKEQEERRRQEQIDLTKEQERQEKEQERQRLAAQQEADRQKRIAEIRAERAKAADEAAKAKRLMDQATAARTASASNTTTTPTNATQATGGQGGTNTNLAAQYAAALTQAIENQWVRPDSVPVGRVCVITIRQLRGGEVSGVDVDPSCPYDDAGRRSVEAAVLRASPLPYNGFEDVFNRNLKLNFRPQG